MKANQKHLKLFQDEEAVSPVIAVILMVAITVVLAATVFVLVNDLGKNVGSTGPSLGLVTDSAGSSNSAWIVKASSATKLADLTDYKFIVSTSSNGTMVFSPASATFTAGDTQYVSAPDTNTDRKAFDAAELTASTGVGYQMTITDIDGNSKYSVGDTIRLKYDSGIADESAEAGAVNTNNFDNTFPSGEYSLEILHTPSGSSAGSLPRTVG